MDKVEQKVAPMDIQAWRQEKFLPWKAEMEKYNAARKTQMEKLHAGLEQLETIVALLLEGRTRQAMLAWNTLELHPKLSDLRLSDDGQTLRLIDTAGAVTLLRLDELILELQRMVDGADAGPGN